MTKFARFLLPAVILAGAFWLRAAPARDEDRFGEVDRIAAELGRISGLKPLHKIKSALIGKAEVKRFIEQRIKETVKPEELRAEELTLKKFGFAPPDFDLKKTTVDLLSEQAAAFYDFRKKKLFMIDSGTEMVQHSALVHEIAHALADQHFHLQKFIDRVKDSDDAGLARMAVMEGQATWLMSEYLTERTGQSLKGEPALVRMMSRSVEAGEGQYPVFDRSPLYLRETLLFPYTKGMLFQHAVFEKLGVAAFSEVFRNPPETTQQILHPEKYLEHVKEADPALPALVSNRGYRDMVEGTVGELDHSILLRQYAGEKEADAVAPSWRGGHYRMLESKKDGRLVLEYASEWDSPEAARRFFRLYRRVLQKKWKRFEPVADEAGRLTGRGDDGYFVVRCEQNRVTSLEGMKTPQEAKRDAPQPRVTATAAGMLVLDPAPAIH